MEGVGFPLPYCPETVKAAMVKVKTEIGRVQPFVAVAFRWGESNGVHSAGACMPHFD